MRVIGFAGWSGSGKTTLIVKLIPALIARGLSVSTLKHAHHSLDIDKPRKDSYAHREAGAREVLVASAKRWALMHELRDEDEPRLLDLLQRLSAVDLIIVEGFKSEAHAKIEVHRAGIGKPFLFPEDRNIVAIASDVRPPFPDAELPFASLDDVEAIGDLVIRSAEPLDETCRRLRKHAQSPSPLVGEGRGGGLQTSSAAAVATPTPYPSPQGGGGSTG
jgi:molybdopterin-guanine dinucleotide biosynthesis protein B